MLFYSMTEHSCSLSQGQLETSLPVGLFIYLLSHSFGVKRVIAHNWVYFCSSTVHIFLMMALKYLNIHRKYLKQSLDFHLCINLKFQKRLGQLFYSFRMKTHFQKCNGYNCVVDFFHRNRNIEAVRRGNMCFVCLCVSF